MGKARQPQLRRPANPGVDGRRQRAERQRAQGRAVRRVKINFASETVPLDRFVDDAERTVLERHAAASARGKTHGRLASETVQTVQPALEPSRPRRPRRVERGAPAPAGAPPPRRGSRSRPMNSRRLLGDTLVDVGIGALRLRRGAAGLLVRRNRGDAADRRGAASRGRSDRFAGRRTENGDTHPFDTEPARLAVVWKSGEPS